MKVDSVIKEKNADAMAWVTFFDPAHYGLHGDWAENGFRISKSGSCRRLIASNWAICGENICRNTFGSTYRFLVR